LPRALREGLILNIHVLGICGTFMGGIAALAREFGHRVTGSDQNVYPPMSTQLEALGIPLARGYSAELLSPPPDLVVVGNALSRGNAAVEHMLDAGLRYVSGPEWLGSTVLAGRRVLAVAGTHGKTTTTSLATHLLAAAGKDPGFLVGGVPHNFGVSARLGTGAEFVVEADEYDTAFFDKRSKFVHYRPEVAILNNLEFDHADIFPDVAAIQRQFHHLVRTVPRSGRLIVNGTDARLSEVLEMGCWTPVERFGWLGSGCDWEVDGAQASRSIEIHHRGARIGKVDWPLPGRHNALNAVAAVAAVTALGVDPIAAVGALASFRGVRRRLEQLVDAGGLVAWDDFAHHPTAIAETLAAVRARLTAGRLIAVVEPRSNSMRAGAHAAALPGALDSADRVLMLVRPELAWQPEALERALGQRFSAHPSTGAMLESLLADCRPGDRLVFMSNGGFENLPGRFAVAWGQAHAGQ
jgi:UDP-N-acetylmuramate: L-alanyl-gamma-D-glutamyl-meso-diaminopimelate ligase